MALLSLELLLHASFNHSHVRLCANLQVFQWFLYTLAEWSIDLPNGNFLHATKQSSKASCSAVHAWGMMKPQPKEISAS